MKRNKYYPNHYLNSVRKRNCVRIKPKFDKSIDKLTYIIENSSSKVLIIDYIEYIDHIRESYCLN
jgi:hypothetical protein